VGRAPRVLQGWEPEEVTAYEYDSDGRLVRSVTTRESEFDDEQRTLLLAIIDFESGIGAHGHPYAEAMSDEADPTNYGGHWRYEGVGPFTDHAEKAKADAIDTYKAQFPKDAPPNMNGLVFRVVKHPYPNN